MRVCELCGCSDIHPCLGGLVFTSEYEARETHRLVGDSTVLPVGFVCAWLPLDEHTVCTAHTLDELDTLAHPFELEVSP